MNPRLVEHHGIERPFFAWLFWILMASLYVAMLTSNVAEHPTRRIFLAVPFCVLAYAYTVAPKRIKTTHYTMAILPAGGTPIRLAYLSDLHLGKNQTTRRLKKIVARVQAEKPDTILIGGDFIDRESEDIVQLDALATLSAPLGVFAIIGNHDYEDRPQEIWKKIRELGWTDATSTLFTLTKEQTSIELMGTDDTFFGHPHVELLRSPHDLPRIVLAHSPDTMLDLQKGDADLVLVGHTHGGQVRLPFIGPLISIPQRGPQSWDRGFKCIHDIPLIISLGLGCSGIRMRFFCPPELVIIDLVGV